MATTETIVSLSSTDLETLVARVNELATAFNLLRSDFNTFHNEILNKIDGSGTGEDIPTFEHSATILESKSILEKLQDLDESVVALWSSQNASVSTRAIGELSASATSNAGVSEDALNISAETKTALALGENESVPVLSAGESVPVLSSGQSVPVLSAGESVPVLSSGQSVPVLSAGESVPVLSEGQSVLVLSEGESVPVLSSGQSVPVLSSGQSVPVIGAEETVVKVNTQQLARAQKLARASRATSRRVR